MSAPSILIVEDDEAIAESLRDIAIEAGLVPSNAATVEDALRQLRVGRFDVALVDCLVRGETCEAILDLLADAPTPTGLILVSASPGMGRLAERWDVTFLEKPFDVEVLLQRLEHVRLRPVRPTRPSGLPPL